jgi:hypothetical protein
VAESARDFFGFLRRRSYGTALVHASHPTTPCRALLAGFALQGAPVFLLRAGDELVSQSYNGMLQRAPVNGFFRCDD